MGKGKGEEIPPKINGIGIGIGIGIDLLLLHLSSVLSLFD